MFNFNLNFHFVIRFKIFCGFRRWETKKGFAFRNGIGSRDLELSSTWNQRDHFQSLMIGGVRKKKGIKEENSLKKLRKQKTVIFS